MPTSEPPAPDSSSRQSPRQRKVDTSGLKHSLARHLFRLCCHAVTLGLRVTGLYGRGMRNAVDIRLNAFDVAIPGLPAAFDGYTLLHMSDLHADGPLDLVAPVSALLTGLEPDLCVLTGDYRFRLGGSHDEAAIPMAQILRHVSARDGIVGVLGNHDLATMIEPLRDAGINILVNEHVTLRRGNETVHVIGLDDVHAYQPKTEAAAHLGRMPTGCRILLQHSPELLDEAEAENVSLYLSGHTHGGQICLPGGWPLMTNARSPRRYASGRWQHGSMAGYTTTGVGVSVMPVRYFCRPEVALITLRRG